MCHELNFEIARPTSLASRRSPRFLAYASYRVIKASGAVRKYVIVENKAFYSR